MIVSLWWCTVGNNLLEKVPSDGVEKGWCPLLFVEDLGTEFLVIVGMHKVFLNVGTERTVIVDKIGVGAWKDY